MADGGALSVEGLKRFWWILATFSGNTNLRWRIYQTLLVGSPQNFARLGVWPMDISCPNLENFDSGVRRCHAGHASVRQWCTSLYFFIYLSFVLLDIDMIDSQMIPATYARLFMKDRSHYGRLRAPCWQARMRACRLQLNLLNAMTPSTLRSYTLVLAQCERRTLLLSMSSIKPKLHGSRSCCRGI